LPGKDEEGNLIVQEPHPILGDLNVRKAIAHALDYKTIIDSVYLGRGYQIASNVLPAVEWAHDPSDSTLHLRPRAIPAAARRGWLGGQRRRRRA
jgi:ABC-type transport system substrate-binding protein